MFAVETKKKNPQFTIAKKQLEYCIEKMANLLPDPKEQFVVAPVICAKKLSGHLKEATMANILTIFGKPRMIALRKYGQDINDVP
jgi:hypothetical protein